jgi:hypothetical protein
MANRMRPERKHGQQSRGQGLDPVADSLNIGTSRAAPAAVPVGR